MRSGILRTYRWLTSRAGYVLLTAGEETFAAEAPARFARAWLDLMILSVVWGFAAAGLYGATWNVFSEYTGIQLMPVAAVVAATVLWLYRRSVEALAGALCGSEAHQVSLGISVIVTVFALALLGIKSWEPHWTELSWLRNWIPRTMFCVLILSPVWGAWAMLAAGLFARAGERTEPAVAQFIAGCGPMTTAICMALPLAATLYVFRQFGWWHLTIPAWAIISAVGGGWLLCRRTGGPTRQALLASNMLTQLAFLLAYLALIR